MRRSRRVFAVLVGAALPSLAAACVDLASLSRGTVGGSDAEPRPLRDGGEMLPDALEGDASSFCGEGARGLFCDRFDDTDRAIGDRWPGIEGSLPSPRRLAGGDYALVAPESPSSPPFALALASIRPAGDAEAPLVAFAREVRSVAPAMVASADIRVETLDAVGTPGVDNADPRLEPIPTPYTPILGFVSAVGPAVSTVQVLLTTGGLFIVTGTDDVFVARARAGTFDYRLTRLEWVRIHVAVGDPTKVEPFVRKASSSSVTCPSSKAVAAVWASVPAGSARCVTAPTAFEELPSKRVGPFFGLALVTPSIARVLVDSVRVDAIE